MAQAVVGVMGPVSLGVLTGCLSALRWISGFIVALMLALALKQWWTGEGIATGLFAAAPVFALAAWGCGWAAQKLNPSN